MAGTLRVPGTANDRRRRLYSHGCCRCSPVPVNFGSVDPEKGCRTTNHRQLCVDEMIGEKLVSRRNATARICTAEIVEKSRGNGAITGQLRTDRQIERDRSYRSTSRPDDARHGRCEQSPDSRFKSTRESNRISSSPMPILGYLTLTPGKPIRKSRSSFAVQEIARQVVQNREV